MPQIRAREEMRLAATIAAGNGVLKKQDARTWWRDRKREAKVQQTTQRPKSWREHFANLRARGFNVIVDGEPVVGGEPS